MSDWEEEEIKITDTDITEELPQLKGSGWKVLGTSQGESEGRIVDTELKVYADGYFNGGSIYNIDLDELRPVNKFISDRGLVFFEPFSKVTSRVSYILARSFSREVNEARDLLMDDVEKRIIVYKTIVVICEKLTLDDDDFWGKMHKMYSQRVADYLEDYWNKPKTLKESE